jgi:hypothetical protein
MTSEQLRRDIDKLRAAACDPDGPLYGSNLVPLIDDITTRIMRSLHFCAITPKEPGWYWWRRLPECPGPVALLVTFEAGKWWAWEGGFGTDGDREPVEELGGEWSSSPIPAP